MGLGFLMQTAFLLPLTVLTLVLAVAALGFRAGRRRGIGPFALGVVAAVLLVVGKFVVDSNLLIYGGIAALLGASLWNSWPTRKEPPSEELYELGTSIERVHDGYEA